MTKAPIVTRLFLGGQEYIKTQTGSITTIVPVVTPPCGHGCLVSLNSLNLKVCVDCKAELPWTLKPGQVPTFKEAYADSAFEPAPRKNSHE